MHDVDADVTLDNNNMATHSPAFGEVWDECNKEDQVAEAMEKEEQEEDDEFDLSELPRRQDCSARSCSAIRKRSSQSGSSKKWQAATRPSKDKT